TVGGVAWSCRRSPGGQTRARSAHAPTTRRDACSNASARHPHAAAPGRPGWKQKRCAAATSSSTPAPATWLPAGTANGWRAASTWSLRSEEHTSELQSRENLVCRLLLEKKKLFP